jgi:capsular polysaccharide biosynthesis protein
MLGAAVADFVTTERQFRAQGTMYVQMQPLLTSLSGGGEGWSWTSDAQRTVNNMNELLQSEAFVRSAIRGTALEAQMSGGPDQVVDTLNEFRYSLSIMPIGENLVAINATSTDPELARQTVNAIFESFIQWKLTTEKQESVAARDFFANLIKPYREELQRRRDELENYLRDFPLPPRGDRPLEQQMQVDALQAEVNAAQVRVKEAMDKEESALLAMKKAETEIRQLYVMIDAPTLPTRESGTNRQRAMRAGLFVGAGLILSLFAVIGAWLLDRTLRLPLDVRNVLHLPVLTVLPRIKQKPVTELLKVAQPQKAPAKTPLPSTAPDQLRRV